MAQSRKRFLKTLSHRKVRRYGKPIGGKGNWSNKIFDYWWSLW